MKKLTSIILSGIIILNIFCGLGITVSAKTSGDYEYSITDNNAVITGYYGSATELIIPSQLDGYTVTSIGNSAFRGCTSLTSVTIPNSVTSIGNYAFYNSSSLNSVTIPDSVTSIGNYAFSYCESLTSITIPNSVTRIGESAFYNCTSLTSVTIGNSITSIRDNAFSGCSSLKSVKINDIAAWCNIGFSDDDSNPLFYAHNLYLNDTLVTDLTIPDSVTSIGNYAFYNSSSLTSVTIPSGVTSIGGYAFSYCSSLKSITIPNSVTNIGDKAFNSCTSLQSVKISDIVSWCNIKFSSYISNPLYYAHNLYLNEKLITDLVIPDSVTSIESWSFYNCESIKRVTISDSVTRIGLGAFTNTSYYKDKSHWENNVLYIGNHLIKAEISLSGSYSIKDGTLTIADNAFSACRRITNITIPNSVKSIGDDAFYCCENLTSITIPESVKSIGKHAFSYCHKLNIVTIPDSVTSIGDSAFVPCNHLSIAIVPTDFIDLALNFVFPSTTEIRYREKEFIVNYDANGGIDAPEQLLFTSGSKTTSFTVTKQIPSRTGYIFEGWSNEPNGSADYLPGKTYTISNSITLYAVWKATNTYTINYKLCGGIGNIPSQIKTEGIDLKLSSIIPTHAKYTFAYWISSDKQTTYSAGSSYKADANLTLYAVWKEKCPKCDGSQFSSITKCNTCKGKGTVTTSYTCTNCKGTGKKTKTSYETCSNCHGSGTYYGYGLSTNGMGWQFLPCPYCNAKGTIKKVEQVTCTTCGGDGIESSTSWCPECHHAGQIKTKCDECEGKGYFYHYPDYNIEDNPDPYPNSTLTLGDVDGDSDVTIVDATCIQRYLAELAVISYNETAADADGDGEVTILDATSIQRYLAELPCFAGIGNPIS